MLRQTFSRVPSVEIATIAGSLFVLTTSAAWADRQAVLGTINGDGSFTAGRSPVNGTDGLIKESELRVQAESSQEHRLDAKCYHVRATCSGDVIVPLGKFASGTMTINWTVDGWYSSVSGQLTVTSGWGGQTESGPYILNQSGFAVDRVKLRAVKGVGNDWDQYYLYLQYDYLSPGGENTIAAAISTTGNITEEYADNAAATATLLPVLSTSEGQTQRFDFNKDVYVNSSKVLTEATAQGTIKSLPSFAVGSTTNATGPSATAFGAYVTASGTSSFAAGYFANASAYHSIAMGNHVAASGNYSMAINTLTQATGVSSFAIGHNTKANGNESFAGGFDSIAGGHHSFAMGQGSTTIGNDSIALGLNNKAGSQAAAFGWGSEANGPCSFASGRLAITNKFATSALGEGTIANSHGEVVMGMYNNPVPATFPNGFNPAEAVLEIGNGSSESERSNAVTVLKNGQTTLKNKAWSSSTPLTAAEANYSSGNALVVEGHAVLKGKVTLEQPQGDISMGIYGN